ncbi:Ger(x)C family spore germination protein [Paenibacillus sp. 2TAB23]|uniref:Ger(x)C family spore germination protein n=1 Tax=Paenibacillus sp. 2TAB23 TaxID=3233004 RepID=UPI003F974E8B
MRTLPKAAAFLLVIVLVTGCGDQRILEKQGFIQSTGYDLNETKNNEEDNRLMITVDIPKADPEQRMQRETLTTIAHSSKEAKILFAGQTELSLVSGQLRSTLFGLSLAKRGIWQHIDTLVRDPAISQRVKIVVVNGRAHDLLVRDYPQHPRAGQYIDRMLEKESTSMNIPLVTIYDFTRDYFDDGIEPIAPIIRESKKNISFDGVALFKKDRYITKIDAKQSLIFSMMKHNFKKGEVSMELGDGSKKQERLLFSSIINDRDVKVKRSAKGKFNIQINIVVKGSVLEYSGIHEISKDEDRKKIEKLMAEYVEREAAALMETMQKHNVDSLGIGKNIRNSMSYEEWKKLDWDKVYSNADIRISTRIVIKDFGKFK